MEKIKGTHLLECTHSLNSKSSYDYLMQCDILKEMPDGERYKVKVYGNRARRSDTSRIRYVDKSRVHEKSLSTD